MVIVILIMLLFLGVSLFEIFLSKDRDNGLIALCISLAIAAGLMGGIVNGINSINHRNDHNKLSMLDSNRSIYERKYETIGSELRLELSKYPKFESEMFDKISPEKLDLYFVRYPNLRSVESISLLAKQLASLKSAIYDIDVAYNEVVLVMRKRQENQWWYGWMNEYDVNFIKE